jgi:predicted nucleotidyltransferase
VTSDEATLAVLTALETLGVPYMIVGGLANVVWGENRATFDVDITIGLPPQAAARLLDVVGDQLAKVPDDAEQFAADTGVLPAVHRSGVRIDFLLSANAFAEEALARAVDVDVDGAPVKFCTAEDLLLMKIASNRPKDRSDVEAIVRRRSASLDRNYLDVRVRELSSAFGDPEIYSRYLALVET